MHNGRPIEVYLAQPRGFCAGVVRAIEIVERALEKYGPPVYVRHEIVHNKWVVDDLRAKGAILVWEIGDLDHLPPAFSAVAPSAQIGAPFTLPPRRHFGTRPETFNWAILMPQ